MAAPLDDPKREYRTLHCAEQQLTCLREVLADLRPNTKAIAELRELFGDSSPALQGVGEVLNEWRDARLMCPALLLSAHRFCDLDTDVALRRELETEVSALLVEHEMEAVAQHHLEPEARISVRPCRILSYITSVIGHRRGAAPLTPRQG